MNDLKLLFRRLWRNRLFTLLHILGLSIGISACLVIFRIANYEFSYDLKHPAKEQIFKVHTAYLEKGKLDNFDGIPAPLPAYIKENISTATLVVPVFKQYFEKVTLQDQAKNSVDFEDQKNIIGTTADYFRLSDYNWLQGNKEQVFALANEVVLTASRANAYFPNQPYSEMMGKTIAYDSTLFTVSGIVEDLAYPSSFLGKEFIKIPQKDWYSTVWTNSNSNWQLFVKLQSKEAVPQFLAIIDKKIKEMTHAEFSKYGFTMAANVTPLSDLHFTSYTQNSTDKKLIVGLIAIAAFLLLLACINYINLTTAQIPQRAKEIGIRKTLGESSKNISQTFLLETLVLCVLSFIFSWPLTLLLQQFMQGYLPNAIGGFSDSPALLLFMGTLILIITAISSWYPIFLINKVRIAEVIKISSTSSVKLGGISMRKMLIIFQFVIAQVFVVATVIIGMQLKHALSSDLGFNHNAIVTMQLPQKSYQDSNIDPLTLKLELKKLSSINQVALGHLPMSNDHWGNSIFSKTDTGNRRLDVQRKFIDADYITTYTIKLLAGEALTLADTTSAIALNATAIKELGYRSPQEAIGQYVDMEDKPYQIKAVVEDFHAKDMHSKIGPLLFQNSNRKYELNSLSIQLSANPKNWPSTLVAVEKIWKKHYPNAPFKYEFYDEKIKSLYEKDLKFSKIINLSSGITVFLSCLGLIGLVTITTAQRKKEIGIRKVLGSKTAAIVTLLSKDYLRLVVISIAIATPIAWWAMDHWLQDFAYKLTLNWYLFIIPAILTLMLAFITISYHSIKAANANPVDSLRNE